MLRATPDFYPIVECRGCGLLRLGAITFPRPKEEPIKGQPGPDDALALALRRLRQRDAAEFVRDGLETPGPVLEIGDPWLSEPLRRWNIDTECQPRSAVSNLPHRSFAGVALIDCLSMMDDPVGALERVAERLTPDGRLFVRVANAASWQFLALGENWSGLDAPRRRYHFRATDLIHLLDYCGFEVERMRQFSLWESPASIATSLAPGLDPALRRLRCRRERALGRLCRTSLYLLLGTVCAPFAACEAASQAGGVLLVQAKRR